MTDDLHAMSPVHQHGTLDDGTLAWWFWDEAWATRIGPFSSFEEASAACLKYARMLDGLVSATEPEPS